MWSAADQLRANSGLTSVQFSEPVLGLIFLRYFDARFAARRAELEQGGKSGRRGSREDDPKVYNSEGMLYLSVAARFNHLLEMPEGSDVG